MNDETDSMTDDQGQEDKVVKFPDRGGEWIPTPHINGNQICPPDEVLRHQIGELKNVVLVGETQGGGLVMASSLKNRSDIFYLIETVKNLVTRIETE